MPEIISNRIKNNYGDDEEKNIKENINKILN